MKERAITVLSTDHPIQWTECLQEIGNFDFYHLPEYHQLHESQGNAKGILVVFREESKIIALPLLLRPIEGFTDDGWPEPGQFWDATSVYGYAGPIASDQAQNDPVFLKKFGDALYDTALRQNWITVFSRLHPLLENFQLVKNLGERTLLGKTVAIDLTISDEQQFNQFRKGHKYEINRFRREGAEVILDEDLKYLDDFVRIYYNTMKKVDANEYYYFTADYFENLFSMSDGHLFNLFVCEIDGNIVSGGIFSKCRDIIQYHLSGTDADWLKKAPMKLIIDEVRIWASKQPGTRFFHLGGGVGSSEDSLFRFKAGFSKSYFPFHIWKWIVRPEIYQQLVSRRQEWYRIQGKEFPQTDFFPEYRVN